MFLRWISFFLVPVGTAPIYTDEDIRSLKYKKLYSAIGKCIKYPIILALVSGFIANRLDKLAPSGGIYEWMRSLVYMIFGASIGQTASLIACNFFIKKKIVSNKLSEK